MSNTKLSETVRSIMFGEFTNEELNQVVQALKFRRAELAKSAKQSLAIGSKVSFSDRGGKIYIGNVVGIKVKNVIVKTGLTSYRVPASMLTLEE